jgi:putative restriction endonuclease
LKAVFDARAGSGYDDDVARRYHFPSRYLGDAQRALGDWIVYREPRRGGGREGYVAIARVVRIEPDPTRPGHSYAWVADYLR